MSDLASNRPKVIVCQRGARHRYAVPRLFEEAGLLVGLNTDSTANSFSGGVARLMGKLGVQSSRLAALASRVPHGIPAKKVYASDHLLFTSMVKGLVRTDLSTVYMQRGLCGAEVVYSMYGEEYDYLEWAKAQGAKIVVDVFVHPATLRIVSDESMRLLGKSDVDPDFMRLQKNHSKRTFALADLLLCPSQWVAGGVREMFPEEAHKIRVVPYGSSLKSEDSINTAPEAGRILFAGREPLRKGLHYLAEAASLVRQKGTTLDVRVAGVSEGEVGWIEHKTELNCLGTLPLGQVHEEFTHADLLVLPSLSEGQAGVILEAMACGCPVIATRESGVDFEPESGITVPAGNAEALAEAIYDVISDRDRRNRLAAGALKQAENFSMEVWRTRLLDLVNEVVAI